MKKKPKHRHTHHPGRRRVGHVMEYVALRALLTVLHLLPWPLIQIFARVAAFLHATVIPIRRHMILKNLKIAFPEMPRAERSRIARGVAYHSVIFIAELAKLQGAKPEKIWARIQAGMTADEATLNRFRELDKSGRGYILATGHFGNWEWAGAWVVQTLGQLAVVYKPLHNPYVDAYMRAIRLVWKEQPLSTRAGAPRQLLQQLRAGSGVALVADQDARKQGEMIPFFGRPASTATGLASLAVRLQLPILITFAIREAPGRFRHVTEEVLRPQPGAEPKAETLRLMQQYHAALEGIIRRYPEQYFWWHNRWKTRACTSKSNVSP